MLAVILKLLLFGQIVGLGLAECDCDKPPPPNGFILRAAGFEPKSEEVEDRPLDSCHSGCSHAIQRTTLPNNIKIESDETAKKIANELNNVDVPLMRKSCERGCRFVNLDDQNVENEPAKNLNASMGDCLTMCDEEYTRNYHQKIGCRLGCRLRIHHRNVDDEEFPFSPIRLPSAILAIQIVGDRGFPEMMILADKYEPSGVDPIAELFKKKAAPWWDKFGLTQSDLFSRPESTDYGVISESVDESQNEKPTSLPGSDWLRCASRHTGLPGWLLAFSIAAAAISAFWLCILPDKPTDSIEKVTLINPSTTTKLTVYLPDEAPLHKKPPPKYHEVVDIGDPSIQV